MSDPDDPADDDHTVYVPSGKSRSEPEPVRDTADETVYAPRRPTTGPALKSPTAMRYGAAQVEIGMILNGIYAVRRLIGRGGMGEVYEGVNVNDDEDRVAIKVILPSLAADPNLQEMFSKEARALRTLSHPAVVQYRVVAQDPTIGIFYIVTEFIDGPSLAEVVGHSSLTAAELKGLLRRLAEGLRAAHEVGAIHRDISPDNVLLPGGRLTSAKVIDFGIAKDLDTSNRTIIGDGFAGKLGYVAPEQLGDFGRDIGPWTDVYSLGLVLLTLIQGRNVDMGATFVDAVDRRRAGVDLSAVPAELKPILELMLQVDPAKRLRSMDALLDALEGRGAIAPAAKAKPETKQSRQALPLALLIGGGAVLAVGTAVVLFLTTQKAPSGGGPAPSPVVAQTPAPASGRAVLQASLPTVPCSWLRIASAADTANGLAVSITGVAGSTIDAQSAVNRAATSTGARVADLDFGGVEQISRPFCSAMDGFSAFRTDVTASDRLSSAQTKYAMNRDKDGHASARAIINLRPADGQAMALVGIDETGKVQPIFTDRRALDAAIAASQVQRRPDGSLVLQLDTLDPGWSGLLLVTARAPVDVALLTVSPAQRDGPWRERLRQAALAGGWQGEMVWYQAQAPAAAGP